ncbi:MAG: diguanylate cyclase domain-containing protein [Bryobacteraceae bacterium]
MAPKKENKIPDDHLGKQHAALSCYLRAILAAARCMAALCPQVGVPYRERLLRLPRRVGFDATVHSLEESAGALETDLAEFAAAANAWIDEEAAHAQKVLDLIAETYGSVAAADDSHASVLDDLADQMEACAQIDRDVDVRLALRQYATGLRSTARRTKRQKLASLDGLRRQTTELEEWLQRARVATTGDALTGMVNRREMERQLQRRLDANRTFCVLLICWSVRGEAPPAHLGTGGDQIAGQIGQRLATLVRPRDIVCHWGPGEVTVIFDCAQNDVEPRCGQIAGWLSDTYEASSGGSAGEVEAHVAVRLVAPEAGETLESFSGRIGAGLGSPHADSNVF